MVVTAVAMTVAISLGGQLLLLASVARRLATGPPLVSVMARHAILPAWARSRPAALGLEVVQLLAGATGVVAVLLGGAGSWAFGAACLATAVLFTGFAGYLATLLTRRGRVECGCLGGGDRASPAAVWRAGLFAVAALAALALAAGGTLDGPMAGSTPAGTVAGTMAGTVAGTVLASWPARIAVLLAAAMTAAVAAFVVPLADLLAGRPR